MTSIDVADVACEIAVPAVDVGIESVAVSAGDHGALVFGERAGGTEAFGTDCRSIVDVIDWVCDDGEEEAKHAKEGCEDELHLGFLIGGKLVGL